MKKKALALFMTLAIAVCFVPTLSFANEDPATEEPVVQPAVTEQPAATEQSVAQQPEAEQVVEQPVAEPEAQPEPEQAEANAQEEKATEEGNKEETVTTTDTDPLKDLITVGKWNGYTFEVDPSVDVKVAINFKEYLKNGRDTATYLKDLAEEIKAQLSQVKNVWVSLSGIGKNGELALSSAFFSAFDTKVIVKDKAKQDVSFEYAVDSTLVQQEVTSGGKKINKIINTKATIPGFYAELIENAILVKEGQSEGYGRLVLRTDFNNFEWLKGRTSSYPLVTIIKENKNNGNYESALEMYATLTSFTVGEYLDFDEKTGKLDFSRVKVAKFNNASEINVVVDELTALLNGSDSNKRQEYMLKLFSQDTMVFTHNKAPTKKISNNKDDAVGTGDSMNLALFGGMAVLALMGAAAVFATRREQ